MDRQRVTYMCCPTASPPTCDGAEPEAMLPCRESPTLGHEVHRVWRKEDSFPPPHPDLSAWHRDSQACLLVPQLQQQALEGMSCACRTSAHIQGKSPIETY